MPHASISELRYRSHGRHGPSHPSLAGKIRSGNEVARSGRNADREFLSGVSESQGPENLAGAGSGLGGFRSKKSGWPARGRFGSPLFGGSDERNIPGRGRTLGPRQCPLVIGPSQGGRRRPG